MIHILLIEDNPIDARLTQRMFESLTDWPVRITWIDDGEKALWFLQSLEAGGVDEPPALVLLDLNLPKYDGLEVLEAFRGSALAWNMPIFFLSSTPLDETAALVESRNLRAEGYFEKPLNLKGFEDFARKIRAITERLNFLEAKTVAVSAQMLPAHR